MNINSQVSEFRHRILMLRPKMVGLSSDSHWITLHSELRGTLLKAFEALDNAAIDLINGFLEDTIDRWRVQSKEIAKLRAEILAGKQKNESGNL